ncbi:hypothetical protein LPJ61_003020 [Coemansia biformis]|uniref:FAD/NAD(P)-binding domain-containing protein n=1 Tax=Coemansia biformis TaxID=1286918 RepID=A0A9W7YCX2_9FUNG|nr:hypothetical protein LPJ61_003020 [Coemansia biformis]
MSTPRHLQPHQHSRRRTTLTEQQASRHYSGFESTDLPNMNIARTSKSFHVVIIGGSFAGIRAAKDLEELLPSRMVTITVVEKRDRYFYNLGALRSVAKRELIDLVWLPYDNIFRYPHNTVIQGEVASVHPNSIILKDGHKMDFDSLLVATGSIYPNPCKVEGTSHEQGKAEQLRYFDMVQTAESILIIGGGPTGVGLAAEIATAYPKKTITLVHSGPRLLSTHHTSNSMSRKAHKKLQSLGIRIFLNERMMIPEDEPLANALESRWLKTSRGRNVFSNLQFLCNGITFNTSFMDTLDPVSKHKIIDSRTGQICVLPTMQINHPELPWIFSAGDVCDTTGEKQAYRADSQGGHVAQCMARMAQTWYEGNSRWFDTPLKHWRDPAQYMSVPLGPDAGVTDTPWIVLGDLPTRIMKSRELFLARRYKEFNLEYPGLRKASRGSISTGSSAADTASPKERSAKPAAPSASASPDMSNHSHAFSKAFANVALADTSHLDDQFESDRISLSRPSLHPTVAISMSPSPNATSNSGSEAGAGTIGSGYPYYDFRHRERTVPGHGSDSSDDGSSDEEGGIIRGPCSPTNIYIHAAACTNCGHVNYSQTTFTSSVVPSVASSSASIGTATSRPPRIRDMSSALRIGPVIPRQPKVTVSPPPPSQRSANPSSPLANGSSGSTATIHLEQYRQASVGAVSH